MPGYRGSHNKWKNGEPLTRSEAMAAQCFACNGHSAELKDDCLGEKSCPLYPFSPWGRAKGVPCKPRCSAVKKRRTGDPGSLEENQGASLN
jgi:hypothetical protein